MQESLTSTVSKLGNTSHAHLDVSRWQVQKNIRNVKHFMRQMTRGFHVGEKLERTISKLEESADLVINLYDRIQIYQDQKRMGDFVSAINKAQVSQGVRIKNETLEAEMMDLQLVITSNAIVTEYNRAVNAFKQQVFPFASSYRYLLHDDLSLDSNHNITKLVHQAEEKLKLLISIVSETKSSIQTAQDSAVISAVFSSNYRSSHPFFIWGHDIYTEEISDLLSGQEVFLKAELEFGANFKNAVKFSLINLNIRATNESLQGDLNEAIKCFDVHLTHFGNSHYRCGEKFYVLSGESQTITHSFEKYNNLTMTPVRSNRVYKKIRDGDISLSPYAMWGIQLDSLTSSFEALRRFKGKVNLELIGEGQYVKRNAAVCKDSLDPYYKINQDYDN